MEERRAWITMRDGVRLAARLWLPDAQPAPVVLEALPYRMDDLTSSYASEYERLCTEGGLAVCRLDIRGTGSSEGIAEDEYTQAEHDDICETIAWLAAAEWSNGRVGMYGTSWSGFNAIQVACLRPPALGAIVPIYATDDRYTDDVHYMGGALRAVDLVDWVTYMVACNALPPVPSVYGEGWREEWLRRLEGTEPWVLRWLEEQVDGPYWRHGSLRPDYARIACPTMIVAGWADGYRNNTFRTFEALRCPRRLLIGPWSHMSTQTSLPGPHVDLVPELGRWFRRWLADEPNGVEAEPPIAVFVRRSTRPAPDLPEMRGDWRFEPVWPPERLREGLLTVPGDGRDGIATRGDVGTAAWISCAGKLPWGQPDDQRPDDALSLVYEWEPLAEELEILGYARLRLTVVSTVPVAYLSAKLCDVFPDGTSALVTRGLLNLTHRHGHTRPEALEPGAPTPVEIVLEATSWVFEAGHRLRLSLAGSDWPNVWPPPAPATLEVERSTVELRLPVLVGPAPLAERPSLPPATGADAHAPAPEPDADEPPVVWRIERDVLGRETEAAIAYGSSYDAVPQARIREHYEGRVGVSTDDPGRAWARASAAYRIAWPEADVLAEAQLEVTSDAERYVVAVDVLAEELGDAGIGRFQRRFERAIERKLA
ncbi:MAG TPA: CocE/NonD family hydrolase [Gaiella sp.]